MRPWRFHLPRFFFSFSFLADSSFLRVVVSLTRYGRGGAAPCIEAFCLYYREKMLGDRGWTPLAYRLPTVDENWHIKASIGLDVPKQKRPHSTLASQRNPFPTAPWSGNRRGATKKLALDSNNIAIKGVCSRGYSLGSAGAAPGCSGHTRGTYIPEECLSISSSTLLNEHTHSNASNT